MKLFSIILFTAQVLILSNTLFSQSAKPFFSKEPVWITKNVIDYNKTSLDKDAADGYIDISFETQVSLAERSRYFRLSKKILTQAGVQNGSEITVEFDPTYEQLEFHSVRIIRKDEILNRLQLSNIKIVHREKDLQNFIYNGKINAVLILEDVRQGDIIEYSYTIKGFNPIYKNKYTDEFSMSYSVPMYQIYYKLIVPPGRKVNIKNLNEEIQPLISSNKGQRIYEWFKKDIPPIILQDYTPSWYDPYSQILVSEYSTWEEVNNWALELFPEKVSLSAKLQKKINEIESAYANDAEKTKFALRFVQDDIRYMGIEIGENSHKPANPSKVFDQRFGDCKEKSYLLCCMLNAMKIEAKPVMINTLYKKNIKMLLPSPNDFDHVTVRVKLDNAYYWYDPTISYQRGDVKKLFYPDYQIGLVISDTTSALTPIDFRNDSYQHVKEYFKVPTMSGSGFLTVASDFYGSDADDVRNDFNNESINSLLTSYQKFYAYYYEDIKADSLTYKDNERTGVFTTTEYYTIPEIWKPDEGKGRKFTFNNFVIDDILRRPKEKGRKMPFRLRFPANFKEEITVDLPKIWSVTEDETQISNSCFTFKSKFYCKKNIVMVESEYENHKDHATIDEALGYFRDINKYDDNASFILTSENNHQVTYRSQTSTKNIISLVLIILAIVVGVIRYTQKK